MGYLEGNGQRNAYSQHSKLKNVSYELLWVIGMSLLRAKLLPSFVVSCGAAAKKKKKKRQKGSLFKEKLKLCLREGATHTLCARRCHFSHLDEMNHKCVSQGSLRPGFKVNKRTSVGLERWPSGEKHLLFLHGIWALFPVPTWQCRIIDNSSFGGSTPHRSGAHIHKQTNSYTQNTPKERKTSETQLPAKETHPLQETSCQPLGAFLGQWPQSISPVNIQRFCTELEREWV